MSYWIYLVIPTGADETADIWEVNCTSNVSPMWSRALGRPLYELHGMPAPEAADILDGGIEAMEADPATYREMNPPNGWGDSEGALDVLRQLRDACRKHTLTTVYISR